MCDRVDQLPIFPYNRGWSSTQVRRGLYTHYEDSVIKGGRSPIPSIATFDHGTHEVDFFVFFFSGCFWGGLSHTVDG